MNQRLPYEGGYDPGVPDAGAPDEEVCGERVFDEEAFVKGDFDDGTYVEGAYEAPRAGRPLGLREIFALCDRVRETAFAVHRYLRQGYVEKVYENALAHRLRKLGVEVTQQHWLRVYDEDGALLGRFRADLVVEGQLLVEVKACSAMVGEHIAQLLGYMRGAHIEHGLLVNFGGPVLGIKKYVLSELPPAE